MRWLAASILILFAVPASGIHPPKGDAPGEYYREYYLPDVERKNLPVKDKWTHDSILETVAEKDRVVRAETLRALGAIADAADKQVVLDQLDDSVGEVRREALRAFSRISVEDFVQEAGKKLSEDTDARVRKTAASLLGRLKMGGKHLADALRDRDPGVREMAAVALGRLGGKHAGQLKVAFDDPFPVVRAACASALVEGGVSGAAGVLSRGLADSSSLVRGTCASALGSLGPEAAEGLAEHLREEKNSYVLQSILMALGAVKDEKALSAIQGMLGHPDMGVRTAAARACGALADPSSAGQLGILFADEHYQVREAARNALTAIAAETSGPVFLKYLAHRKPEARREAAWGLGIIRHVPALEPLCKMVSDEDEEVRIMTCWAIGRLGLPEGADTLCRASSDGAPAVRTEAARSLGLVDTPAGRDTLVKMLGDKDSRAVATAARSIGHLKHPAAAEVMKVLNNYTAVSSRARENAAWALGELGAKEAIPSLRKLLTKKVLPVPMGPPMYDSDATRIQLIRSLVKLGYDGLLKDLTGAKRLTGGEFVGGYHLKTEIAEALSLLTGKHYTFDPPRPSYTRWFINSIDEKKEYDPNMKLDDDKPLIIYEKKSK